MKSLLLLFTITLINSPGYTQTQIPIGFLKPGIKPVYIKDIEYSWKPKLRLSRNIYFEILSADSSKFKIQATCLTACDTADTAPCWTEVTGFIDSSYIIQFDSLPEKEMRQRIDIVFDYYISLLRQKNYGKKIEFEDESKYEPIRGEFVKYWLQTKDEQLLQKWFILLSLDGGSSDEMQETFAAKLFCTAPDDFIKVLNKLPKKTRDYLVYIIKSTGITYYVTYNFPLDGHVSEREEKYIQLLNTKLASNP